MTNLKFDPHVLDQKQPARIVKTTSSQLVKNVNPPLFVVRKRSFWQKLKSQFSTAVFTAGLYLKFIGGKK